MTSVTIPNSVTSIGECAFGNCSKLSSVHISDLASWCKISFAVSREHKSEPEGYNDFIYDYSSNPLTKAHHLYLNGTEIVNLIIPDGVTYISSYAFRGCSSLTSVTIPNSMTSIGECAFSYCSKLSSVHISDLASWCKINFSWFEDFDWIDDFLLSYNIDYTSNPLSIAHHLYMNGSKITDLVIPDGVTSISDFAFYDCTDLTSLTIPNSVTNIGVCAFFSSNLTDVYCFAQNVPQTSSYEAWWETLYSFTFNQSAILYVPATALSSYKNTEPWSHFSSIVTLEEIVDDENHISFSDRNVRTLCLANWDADENGALSYEEAAAVTDLGTIFKDDTSISSFNELQYFTGLTAVDNSAFSGCSSLTSVSIPNSVTSIGESSFSGCSCLNSINIPQSVSSISTNAFAGCTSLTSVHISDLTAWCRITFNGSESNPLYHARHLFLNGSEVTNLVIPNSVTSIGKCNFIRCIGLTSVTIPNGVTSIGSSAFSSCSGLTSVTIPESVTTIGSYAFYFCKSLTSITIPNSVTSIGNKAFQNCSGLTSITIGDGVKTIGENVFANCGDLPNVYCYAVNVPSTQGNAFDNTNVESSVLHVPRVAIDSYSTIAPWCNFGNILPVEIVEDENHISFADLKVRALCVANWDTDGNGSLSYEEAAAVTDLGDVFADNTNITSFDELQYFTGLTAIGDNAFMGCNHLATVTLPESIVSIGAYAFYGCSALTLFTIPQGVSNIGSYAFRGCTGLTDVYCLPQEVPTTASNAFYNSNIGNATLHVLVSSYNSYKNAVPWKNFKNMLGDIPVPCATPVISYVDGELVFTCDTEGVEFNSSITSADMGERKDSRIGLCVAYDITVYATKEGYNPSETVTATLCWVDAEPVNQVATGTLEIAAVPVLVKSRGGVFTVEGIGDGTEVKVYTTGGMLVGSATAVDQTATISTSLTPGTVAVVDLGKKAVKVVVR